MIQRYGKRQDNNKRGQNREDQRIHREGIQSMKVLKAETHIVLLGEQC